MNVVHIIYADMDEMTQNTTKKSLKHAYVILLLCRKVRVKEFTDGRIVNMMQALDAGWIVEHPRRATQAKEVPDTEERPTETSGPRRPQLQHLHLGVPLIDEDSQAHMDQMSML